jgi:hypothetical protein
MWNSTALTRICASEVHFRRGELYESLTNPGREWLNQRVNPGNQRVGDGCSEFCEIKR